MIVIRVNPVRIESVDIVTSSDLEEDVDLAVYPLVRRHLQALEKDLRGVMSRVVGQKGDNLQHANP